MAKPKHFIRQWRKYRGLTLKDVAARCDSSHATISRIERGAVAYTQQKLECFARVFQCAAGDLLTKNPLEGPVGASDGGPDVAATPLSKPNFLKDWRDFRGLRQANISMLLGLSTQQISNIERGVGELTPELLDAFADIYKTTTTDLLTRPPPKRALARSLIDRLDERDFAVALALLEALAERPAARSTTEAGVTESGAMPESKLR